MSHLHPNRSCLRRSKTNRKCTYKYKKCETGPIDGNNVDLQIGRQDFSLCDMQTCRWHTNCVTCLRLPVTLGDNQTHRIRVRHRESNSCPKATNRDAFTGSIPRMRDLWVFSPVRKLVVKSSRTRDVASVCDIGENEKNVLS